MAEETQSPAGGVTAHLTIRDGRGSEAIEFYKQAFGAHEEMRNLADDGKRLMHAHLKVWDEAVAAGAAVKFPLENQFWGDRYGQLEDPFGFTWSIGGPQK